MRRTPTVLATVLAVALTLDPYPFVQEEPDRTGLLSCPSLRALIHFECLSLSRSSGASRAGRRIHTRTLTHGNSVELRKFFSPSVIRMSFVRDLRCARRRIHSLHKRHSFRKYGVSSKVFLLSQQIFRKVGGLFGQVDCSADLFFHYTLCNGLNFVSF